jgi:large subunit ribosomal protein L10
MLLYAFNGDDEVAAAQVLNTFAKQNPTMEFVGAISAEGEFLDGASVKALAGLPGKNQLIAGLINTLNAPLNNIRSSLSGNLSGILSGLEAKAK